MGLRGRRQTKVSVFTFVIFVVFLRHCAGSKTAHARLQQHQTSILADAPEAKPDAHYCGDVLLFGASMTYLLFTFRYKQACHLGVRGCRQPRLPHWAFVILQLRAAQVMVSCFIRLCNVQIIKIRLACVRPLSISIARHSNDALRSQHTLSLILTSHPASEPSRKAWESPSNVLRST